jgi:hypothetical protein
MWPGRRLSFETVSVTPISADGALEPRTFDVGLGKENAEVVELPADTQSVRIERPVRGRVDLGRLRGIRHPAPRQHPSWRDDSDLWLRWRHWRTERDTRRAHRRRS